MPNYLKVGWRRKSADNETIEIESLCRGFSFMPCVRFGSSQQLLGSTMSRSKLTAKQEQALSIVLREIEGQSTGIHENIEFLRENARLPPFANPLATPSELLALIRASEYEFIKFAKHQVPIYLGCKLIEEFKAHWSVERLQSMAMFGQPYIDGFGNIEYENIYLPMLRLEDDSDIIRFNRFRTSCRRASNLLAQFTETFSSLANSSILRSDLEEQCRSILPKNRESKQVWRSRITKYAKLLKIKIKRG